MALLTAAAAPGGAGAQSLPEDMSISLGLAGDKVTRGLSRTGGQPSLLFDAGWRSATGWQLSLSGAMLRERVSTEAIVGLDWHRQLDARWQLQAGVARYLYLQTRGLHPYTEAHLALDWDGRPGLQLAVSPDTRLTRSGGAVARSRTMYGELTWHQRLHGAVAVDLARVASSASACRATATAALG